MLLTVVSLLLSFIAAPTVALGGAADDFVASLQVPVDRENLTVVTADDDLEIDFFLPGVGHVVVAVYAEDEGSGGGLVIVGDVVAAETRFVDGDVAWEESNFSALPPAQARTVAASVLQVWQDTAVAEVLAEDRNLKCSLTGKIAGATIGVAVLSACGLVTKHPKCIGYGLGALYSVSGHVAEKCNGGQRR